MKVTGRTTVSKLKTAFKDEFKVNVCVYDGEGVADENATLSSIRTMPGSLNADIDDLRGNMKVSNVERILFEKLGVVVKFEASPDSLADGNATVASLRIKSDESSGEANKSDSGKGDNSEQVKANAAASETDAGGSKVSSGSDAVRETVPGAKDSVIRVTGRTTVAKLKNAFRDEFRVNIRVYDGADIADDNATLSSIRTVQGSLNADIDDLRGNMRVSNVERMLFEKLGVVVRFEASPDSLADGNATVASLRIKSDESSGESNRNDFGKSFSEVKNNFAQDSQAAKSAAAAGAPESNAAQEKVSDDDYIIRVTGRTTVARLKNAFRDEFRVNIRVYDGADIADDNATLSSIRTVQGSLNAEIDDLRGNMRISNVERLLLETLGVVVRFEASPDKLADGSATVASVRIKSDESSGADSGNNSQSERQKTSEPSDGSKSKGSDKTNAKEVDDSLPRNSGFRVTGRTTVSKFKSAIKDGFLLDVCVYAGDELADDNATLSSIRTAQGSLNADIDDIRGNMKVANAERQLFEKLGVVVRFQVSPGVLADGNATVASLRNKADEISGESKITVSEKSVSEVPNNSASSEANQTAEPKSPEAKQTAVPESPETIKTVEDDVTAGNNKDSGDSDLTQEIPQDAEAGGYIRFGSYYQDNAAEKTPVEWLVLEKKTKELLLISRYALECKQYHHDRVNVTWEKSDLRKWLNNDFLKEAFSAEERERIKECKLKNDDNPEENTKGGNDTKDRVFLLSIQEAGQYFTDDDTRKCKSTKFAEGKHQMIDEAGFSDWWLRSPGTKKHAAIVFADGVIDMYGTPVNKDGICSVRPVLWLILN